MNTTLTNEEILALVRSKSRKLQWQIRMRDWRETIASLIVIAFLAPAAIHGNLLSRTGVGVVVGGLIFIGVKLHRARSGRTPGMDAPVAVVLRADRERIDAQIMLLESVLSWYIAPIMIGSILIVASVRAPWVFMAGYVVIVALLSWGIQRLNAFAARSYLRPRRDELTALLSQIESSEVST